jgi:HK97 family phage portal protein
MNSQAWRSTMIVQAALTGNAFSFIERKNGFPTAITFTKSIDTAEYTIKNGELFYHYKEKDKVQKISANDIIHIKGISSDGTFGLSPAKALAMQLGTSYAGYKTLEKHYKGGARPGMLLKNTVPVTAKEAKNLETGIADFESKISGLNKQGKIVNIPMNTEPIPWNISIEDAKILETIKFNRADIAALYGIPAFMIGDYQESKFNSIEYLTRFFNSFTIRPQANVWRKELEDKLLTDGEWKEGASIEFNTNALIETDTAAKTDSYQKYIQNGILSPLTVAELEGFPTKGVSNKYFLSNNHVEYETAMQKKELEIEKLQLEMQKLKTNP